jgi:hypothetical protein
MKKHFFWQLSCWETVLRSNKKHHLDARDAQSFGIGATRRNAETARLVTVITAAAAWN